MFSHSARSCKLQAFYFLTWGKKWRSSALVHTDSTTYYHCHKPKLNKLVTNVVIALWQASEMYQSSESDDNSFIFWKPRLI